MNCPKCGTPGRLWPPEEDLYLNSMTGRVRTPVVQGLFCDRCQDWIKNTDIILRAKQYFSSMDVEQHAWATEELISSARESVEELEEDLRCYRSLTLCFISLADFDLSGVYRIGPETLGFIRYPDGAIEWHFPPGEAAFIDFERECRSACDSFHDYLIRLLSYAFAHGMDVVKADETGRGQSILHVLERSDVHTDAPYEN